MLSLHDTRSGGRVPLHLGRTVRVYACGITPYDSAHLGHAFTYTIVDTLVGVLAHRGHQVRYVRNVTDVDDDILRKARETGRPFDLIAREEVARFERELAAIGCRMPDASPRATAAVPAIVQAVRGLVAGGSAYALDDGRVYFDTATEPDYAAMARLDEDELLAQFAEKGGDPDAPGKRNRLDFLLWQPSADDEPSWASDWGPGRPGWHIECSVMANEELGSTIDIHAGGDDLVFPHHAAEIVQAEHLTGQSPFVRAWLHCGMVALDGTKMSKSLGNLVFIRDLLAEFEGDALRAYLLSHPYRGAWTFDRDALAASAETVRAWRKAIDDAPTAVVAGAAERANARIDDDLDIPGALAVIDDAAAMGAGRTVAEVSRMLGFRLA